MQKMQQKPKKKHFQSPCAVSEIQNNFNLTRNSESARRNAPDSVHGGEIRDIKCKTGQPIQQRDPSLGRVWCLLGRRTSYAEYSILRSMRHKELTSQDGHFVRHLHMLRQFRANVIWIVTFWLQCHISIFIAIIKLNNILPLVRGPVRRFRNVRHHCLVSEHSTYAQKIFADENLRVKNLRRPRDIEWHFGPGRRRIFVVRKTSNTPLVTGHPAPV